MIAALRSARAWLDLNLFPDAPAPSRMSARHVLAAILAAAALMAIQLARMWPSAPLNSVWAEDGTTYLVDAKSHGFLHNLAAAHADYLQVVPRLLTQATAALPLTWFAAATALAGAAVVTACAFLVWHSSAGHIRSRYLRTALAALVVLVPVAGVEMFDNLVNTIWFLIVVGFWLLLWRPAGLVRAAAAAVVLFLAALSSAGLIFMLPLWALRAIAIRDRRDGMIVGAYGAGMLVQLGVLAGQKPVTASHWAWGLVPAYVQRVVGGALTGDAITGALWKHLGISVEVVLGVALISLVGFALGRSNSPARVLVPLAAAISLVMFLGSGYQRDLGSALLWPHGTSNSIGSRYVVVPTLLLSSALFALLDARPRLRATTVWNAARMGTALFVLVAALFSFDASDPVRGSPTWSAALSSARSACARTHAGITQIPIAPPPLWTVPLRCSELH